MYPQTEAFLLVSATYYAIILDDNLEKSSELRLDAGKIKIDVKCKCNSAWPDDLFKYRNLKL